MRGRRPTLLLTTLLLSSAFAGDTVDEDELFSGAAIMVDSSSVADSALDRELNGKSVSLSGTIAAFATGEIPRKPLDEIGRDDAGFTTAAVGNILLDIRLPGNVKSYANLEVAHIPALTTTMVGLKELFVDVHIAHRVYLRAGKQVLKWGPCSYWNPTDLINVEPEPFVDRIGYREGTYGLKIHAPFGTAANLYGFIDTHNSLTAGDPATALRFEFLAKGTELGVSTWAKNDAQPVFGFDFSTGLPYRLNATGEIGLSYGDNRSYAREADGILYLDRRNEEWVPRICVGVDRKFALGQLRDRVEVRTEFYHDYAGYRSNMFDTGDTLVFADPVIGAAPGKPALAQTSGTRADFFFGHRLYEENRYGRFYLALSTSIAKFIMSDMTLQLRAIGDLERGSCLLSSDLTYATLHGFWASLLIVGRLGPEESEYTYQGRAAEVRVAMGLFF